MAAFRLCASDLENKSDKLRGFGGSAPKVQNLTKTYFSKTIDNL